MEVHWSDFLGENFVIIWCKFKTLAGYKLAVSCQFDVSLSILSLLLILIGLISLKRLFAILPKITFARSNRADAEIQTELEGPPYSNQDMAGQAEAGNPESKLRDHQLHGQNYDWKNFESESTRKRSLSR